MNEVYFENYSNIIFDLDDTIIFEKDYLFEVYRLVSKKANKCGYIEKEIFDFLINEFNNHGRKDIYQKLTRKYESLLNINEFLDLMRGISLSHPLNINSKVKYYLEQLCCMGKSFDILTNGNVIQQKNKINQTDFGPFCKPDLIIYANEYQPKPSINSFLAYKSFKAIPGKAIYIGDSEIDANFAFNCGIDFLDINSI